MSENTTRSTKNVADEIGQELSITERDPFLALEPLSLEPETASSLGFLIFKPDGLEPGANNEPSNARYIYEMMRSGKGNPEVLANELNIPLEVIKRFVETTELAGLMFYNPSIDDFKLMKAFYYDYSEDE